jgi:hypothetical protein
MIENQYRASRIRLRQVSAALMAEAVADGATVSQSGVMDCVVNRQHPERGYVTPRHGAVWVPDTQVRAALTELQAQGGPARLRLLDGLYPPAFLQAMRGLGLRVRDERPMLLCPLEIDAVPPGPTLSARPVELHANGRLGSASVGLQDAPPPGAHDWLLSWNGEPVGAARFGAPGGRAARLILWRCTGPAEDPAQAILLLAAACASPALGVDLLFAETDDPAERMVLREIGFRDSGAVLTMEGTAA